MEVFYPALARLLKYKEWQDYEKLLDKVKLELIADLESDLGDPMKVKVQLHLLKKIKDLPRQIITEEEEDKKK